jgi:uncharacterized protein YjiS (DUF1127 family)
MASLFRDVGGMARPNASIGSFGPLDRVLNWLKDVFAERRLRAQTLRELSVLSDRELSDLGLSRYDFADIARGTYRRSGDAETAPPPAQRASPESGYAPYTYST